MSAVDKTERSTARATDLQSLLALARTFLGETAPRIILAAVALTVALRIAVAGFGFSDAATVALSIVFVGFLEWVIHAHWLHAPSNSRRMTKLRSGVRHLSLIHI